MRARRWLIPVLAIAVFASVYLLFRPGGDIPFNQAAWLSHPATNRWAPNNLRYRMRYGAAAAARQCKTGDEVLALLGRETGSGDFSGTKPTEPSYSHIYDLGFLRHPFMFWEPRARVEIEVVMDRNDRVLEVTVDEHELDP